MNRFKIFKKSLIINSLYIKHVELTNKTSFCFSKNNFIKHIYSQL
jgi:hypothetical protein